MRLRGCAPVREAGGLDSLFRGKKETGRPGNEEQKKAAQKICAEMRRFMEITGSIKEVRRQVKEWKKQGLSVGLVPTMGYLHEGHKSLIDRAAKENDRVVVSDFVNPIQFGINEDLSTYPRDIEADKKLCEAAGADLINDIRGLKYDDKMAQVIAEAEVPCCLMHNRDNTVYKSFITDVIHDLQESVSLAKKAGIADDKIILDPGVGFGKTYEQNLEIIAKLEKLHTWGYPLLLGCSRKSVIGLTLDLPVSERLEGTLVTTAVGVLKGCSFIRVHDVKENARALRMAEAVRDYCSA